LADAAAELGAKDSQGVAEDPEKRGVWLDVDTPVPTVDAQ
jgi:hypothetical protein